MDYKAIYKKTLEDLKEVRLDLQYVLAEFKQNMEGLLNCEWSHDKFSFGIRKINPISDFESKKMFIGVDIATSPIVITKGGVISELEYSEDALENFLLELVEDPFFVYNTSNNSTPENVRVVNLERAN